MNIQWSEMNKQFQTLVNKSSTYKEGIDVLIELRGNIFGLLKDVKNGLPRKAYDEMPYINAKGYHNKTIAYSIWHIIRIEDIVVHTLMLEDEQVFFEGNYQKKIGCSIITTGNELVKEEIQEFSKQLNIDALFEYAQAVMDSTTEFLKTLDYSRLKEKVSIEARKHLEESNCVSEDENAKWLIEYWCGKDFRGLLKMPLSRHWIMHIEAALRIKQKLTTSA